MKPGIWIERVNLLFRFKIGGVSILLRSKATKMAAGIIYVYASSPFSSLLAKCNPLILRCPLNWGPVLSVLRRVCFSQIGNAIVRSVPINMIKVLLRPAPMHIEPRNPMSHWRFPTHTYAEIPIGANRSRFLSTMLFIPYCSFRFGKKSNIPAKHVFGSMSPNKNTRFWIIIQKLANKTKCDNFLKGHLDHFLDLLVRAGQRMAVLARPEYYNAAARYVQYGMAR